MPFTLNLLARFKVTQNFNITHRKEGWQIKDFQYSYIVYVLHITFFSFWKVTNKLLICFIQNEKKFLYPISYMYTSSTECINLIQFNIQKKDKILTACTAPINI